MTFYNVKDMVPKTPTPGVEMRIVAGDKMMMVFFVLQEGAEVSEHSHPHEQMGTVLKGAMELTVAGEKRVLREGDAYFIPADVPHAGQAVGGLAEVLDIFSPPREDYLKL